MRSHRSSRLALGAALVLLLAAAPAFARGRVFRREPGFGPPAAQQRAQQRAEARAEARANKPQPPPQKPAPNTGGGGPAAPNQHLQRWLANHPGTPEEQQREMQNEPGFRDLPPQVQQQYLRDLQRLNSMPAEKRNRMLDRNEMLERMTPQQQQQYRGAVQQLRSAALPRQRLMAQSILDLRGMPPGQREQVIDSPAFAAQFSPDERSTIRTLLTAEPYNPAPAP